MYEFYMTIGDWSDDGHGQKENFLVHSRKPIKTVREAHFRIPEKTGIDIEAICSGYDENQVSPKTLKRINDLGFMNEPGEAGADAWWMARLWLFLLNKTDETLGLRFACKPDTTPTLHFYGKDEEGRHINSIGYGVL